MENQDKIKPIESFEQVNVQLQGEYADLFLAYMRDEVLPTKASAGMRLIVDGLRRWSRERASQSEVNAA